VAEGPLTQDYGANVLFGGPPKRFRERVERWFTVAFVQSWLAVLLFRWKARLRKAGVPFLPGLCGMLSRALFNVHIGNAVTIGPGLVIPHGNVVIDGRTTIGRGCQINPWVTIGLSNSRKVGFSLEGPTLGDYVHIGTGAKILGPVRVGDYARIGANAVVVHDVPANTTVVGAPARPVAERRAAALDGNGRDQRLAAHMRASIVDYRLHRQSLDALIDALRGSFEIGSDELREIERSLAEQLVRLDSTAAAGGAPSAQVDAALEVIDSALRRVLSG
jgi:serine O-acetyltransferase